MEGYIFLSFFFFVWIMNVWFMIWIVWYCFFWGFMDVFLGNVKGIMALGKWGISLFWGSERHHCFGEMWRVSRLWEMWRVSRLWENEGYHYFRGLHGLAWLYVWRAWLGMALSKGCMAWHGLMCREHGLAWLYLEVAWLGMALRVVGTYTCTWPEEFELWRIGTYAGMIPEKVGTYACTQPEEPELWRIEAYTSMMPEKVETYACTQPKKPKLWSIGAYTSIMHENWDLCLHTAREIK